MTTASTLPPLSELSLGMRRFHQRAAQRAWLEMEDSDTPGTISFRLMDAAPSPWNNEFPTCTDSRLKISYQVDSRTLTVTIKARNDGDREQWGDPKHPSSIETWPHEKMLSYNLHEELPPGTKKFLLGLI